MKLYAIACMALLTLPGCASKAATYDKGTASEAQFSKERYECERDARMLPTATNCQQMRFYENCMQSKGYTQIKPGRRGMC